MRVSLATLAFLLTLAVRHSEANEGESGYSHCSEQRELRGWRLKVGVGSVGGCSEEVWSGKHGLGFLPNRQCLSQGCLPISGRGSLLPPRAGENLPLKTAFLAFGPSLEKLTQSPPSVCSAAPRQEQNLGERKP